MLSRHLLLILGSVIALASPAAGQTNITLDGSIGGPAGTVDATSPNLWELPGSLGERTGSNLFYSFGIFDLATGDTAAFTPDPGDAAAIANVIARVTGGDASDINGTLRSTIPNADVFFLNPAGVLFGGAASIDVPASLTISTAHQLVYSGGESLNLVDPANPTLSVQPPEAFGFDGSAPSADIVFSSPGAPTFYRVPEGETLTAIGGNVTISNRAQVQALGGRVQLAAVGSAIVDVPLDLTNFDVATSADALGVIRIENRSGLDTTPFDANAPQGTVVIRGERLLLDDRSVLGGAGQIGGTGPAVDIAVTGDVTLSDRSQIRSEAQGAQTSGGISIRADDIEVTGDSFIRARVFAFAPGGAAGGDVLLDSGSVRLTAGGIVETSTNSISDAGDIEILATDLTLMDGEVRTSTSASGTAGEIDIQLTGALRIEDGTIAALSSTQAFGGSVTIEAAQMDLVGGESQILTQNDVTMATPGGAGGGITLRGGSIQISDGAIVAAQTSGAERGGSIVVEADSLEIANGGLDFEGAPRESAIEAGTTGAGASGSIEVRVDSLRIVRDTGRERAGRLATTVADGAAGASGDITVEAPNVQLEGGGQISTTTLGDGNSGAIAIDASGGTVVLIGDDIADDGSVEPTGIFTRADVAVGSPAASSANAGAVQISADEIRVEDGAEISTRAIGTGNSGDVTLDAISRLRVAGESGQASAITTRGLEGAGGDVVVSGDVVEVLDGGRIDVSTAGSGTGGELRVDAGELRVGGESATGRGAIITARSDGIGDAQGIVIDADRSVRVETGGTITAATGPFGGSPGEVMIDAASIEVAGGEISTQAGSAVGGDINLQADESIAFTNGATLSARSSGGDAGNVRVIAPSIVVLDSQLIADADAFGGEIRLEGRESILLERAAIEAVSRGGGGSSQVGGNVFIEGGRVVLNQARIAADGFGNADGGNVLLSGNPVLQSSDTSITVSSALGRAGTFVVDAPQAEVTGDLASLPENFLDASALLAEACLLRDGPSGSFSVRQVEALLPAPDAFLAPNVSASSEGEVVQCTP